MNSSDILHDMTVRSDKNINGVAHLVDTLLVCYLYIALASHINECKPITGSAMLKRNHLGLSVGTLYIFWLGLLKPGFTVCLLQRFPWKPQAQLILQVLLNG